MKVETITTIEKKQILTIVESIIDSVCAVVMDESWQVCTCQDDGPCTCSARYQIIATNEEGFAYSPDHHGAWVGLSFPENGVIVLDSTTCGGTNQEIRFDLTTGQINYVHNGNRQSGGGLIWDHLPELWQGVNRVKHWFILNLETAEPKWGVQLPLLQGQFGESPCNLQEHMNMQNEAKLAELKMICKAAGITAPPDIIYDGNGFVNQDTWKSWSPDLTGVHYRRLAANGLRL